MGAGSKVHPMVTPQQYSPNISKFQDNQYQTPQQEKKYSPLSHPNTNQPQIYFNTTYVQSSEQLQPSVVVHRHHPPPQQFYGHQPVEMRDKPSTFSNYI